MFHRVAVRQFRSLGRIQPISTRYSCYPSSIHQQFTRPVPYLRSFMNNVSSDDSTTTTLTSNNVTPEEILDQCSQLYSSLTVLSDKLGGVAIPNSSPHTSMPFCLLVGNHSSGKSSFINYVLQRNIQKAGVAPTDDSFTVIAPGPNDTDADGPTLVSSTKQFFISRCSIYGDTQLTFSSSFFFSCRWETRFRFC